MSDAMYVVGSANGASRSPGILWLTVRSGSNRRLLLLSVCSKKIGRSVGRSGTEFFHYMYNDKIPENAKLREPEALRLRNTRAERFDCITTEDSLLLLTSLFEGPCCIALGSSVEYSLTNRARELKWRFGHHPRQSGLIT